MRQTTLPILLLIVLLGAGLRFGALAHDGRFHPDEALFATFARSAALNGAWMLPGALDKPPLAIYSIALTMLPFTFQRPEGLPELSARAGEIAARLPGLIASLLLIPLTYALAQRLYRQRTTALLAALLVSVSPFAVAFSATAFTDGVMLLLATLALYMIVVCRAGWAGVWLACAFASKSQAIFIMPLIMGLAWALRGRQKSRLYMQQVVGMLPAGTSSLLRARSPFMASGLISHPSVLRFFTTFMAGVLLLLLWDALREQPTGIFALAWANNDPSRLIRPDEVMPRLLRWGEFAQTLFTPMSALFIPAGLVGILWRLRYGRSLATSIDITLALFIAGYFALHWLVAFNVYDRYLLLILIPLALLTARGLLALYDMLIGRLPLGELRFVGLLFIGAMAVSAWDAAQGKFAIGTNSTRLQGIDVLAEQLNDLTLGAILYDHWLGWELDYYLGMWTDKRRVYYPTPDALAEDALLQPDPAPRYFIVPRWAAPDEWLGALNEAGFDPQFAWRVEAFTVYRLLPP
jgi:4-amino-4-deoxy-L-arabinose transferase-like glycosyltransferase